MIPKALFQFLRHACVPADNNLAERTLRPLVVQRKISGGSRSRQGSATRMRLASCFETWQARKLNPLLERRRQLRYEPTPCRRLRPDNILNSYVDGCF